MRIVPALVGAVVILGGVALSARTETVRGGVVLANGQPSTYRLSLSSPAATAVGRPEVAPQIVVPRGRTTTAGTGQSATVSVVAQRQWTPTNVTVHAGDRLSFQVTGQIRPTRTGAAVGPGGEGGSSPNYPVPSAPMGALIGRVGNGQPFLIGASGALVTMPADGQLFLGINDDNVSDNSGSFAVRVGPPNAVGTSGQSALLPGQGNTFTVEAKRPWTPTGISVQQGDRLTFRVTGTVSWGHGPNDQTTGDGGALDPQRQSDYPVPAAGVAALIGRVNGQPFAIGRSGQPMTMPASGELFLGINDDYFGDNNGAYTVTVQMTSGATPRR